jgi:hypothetical protein
VTKTRKLHRIPPTSPTSRESSIGVLFLRLRSKCSGVPLGSALDRTRRAVEGVRELVRTNARTCASWQNVVQRLELSCQAGRCLANRAWGQIVRSTVISLPSCTITTEATEASKVGWCGVVAGDWREIGETCPHRSVKSIAAVHYADTTSRLADCDPGLENRPRKERAILSPMPSSRLV